MTASSVKAVSHLRWQVVLLLTSGYLIVHFLELIPYSEELFSSAGIFPQAEILPTFPNFPNPLFWADQPWIVQGLLVGLIIAAAGLPLRRFAIPCALLLWFGWACLLTRNPLIRNPGMPYVGWMLLAIAATTWINRGEGNRTWRFPPSLFWLGWFLLGAGYTLSGLHKMASPSWADGTALSYLLQNPLARPGVIGGWLAAAPEWFLQAQTWLVLALETLALPLFCWSRTRPLAWLGLIGMHCGIMLTVDFVDLTMGMLLFHAFLFDERWIPRRGAAGVVFFDGVCNLCNQFASVLLSTVDKDTLRIASLQGETAREKGIDKVTVDTIIFLQDGITLTRSDALIAIGQRAGGLLRVAAEGARLIPRGLRDRAYDWIARNRYRFLGKKDTCRIPTPEEKEMFLP